MQDALRAVMGLPRQSLLFIQYDHTRAASLFSAAEGSWGRWLMANVRIHIQVASSASGLLVAGVV